MSSEEADQSSDKLARWFGDPTNEMRREWIRRLGGPEQDFTIRDHAERPEISLVVLGDTGETTLELGTTDLDLDQGPFETLV